MKTEELIQQRSFYMEGVDGFIEAFVGAVGPEIEVWYRKERKRLADDTIREENWFLTPSKIVCVTTTAKNITFNAYARDRIVRVRHQFQFNSGFGITIQPPRVTITFEGDLVIGLPLPDDHQVDEHGQAYMEFVCKLL